MGFHYKINLIQEEPESRREWMLDKFEFAGRYNPKIKNYKFWQDGNKPIVLFSPAFTTKKLNYIHQNPVKDRIDQEPHEYLFSSAKNYASMDGLLDVILLD
jgi:putative transposase